MIAGSSEDGFEGLALGLRRTRVTAYRLACMNASYSCPTLNHKTTTVNLPRPRQLSMADDASRSLLCLIEGDSSLFRVKPTGSMDIMELKDLIFAKGQAQRAQER
jgi:hypothetical protein